MSYWEHRKPVHRSRAVDVRDIARISVELLNEGGLRALTIRTVAAQLEVAPASLYSRIASVDDLFDLALDEALGQDAQVQQAAEQAGLHALLLAWYRHLVRHPWACQVIAMRAPRGPHYLRLSDRICVLLSEGVSADPLSDAYAVSNFVIGSATTVHVAGDERNAAVDDRIAPFYASLHAEHAVDAEAVLNAGLRALLSLSR